MWKHPAGAPRSGRIEKARPPIVVEIGGKCRARSAAIPTERSG
jgi:hypothetical protein